MRHYVIRKGQFEGIYAIYDNPEELYKYEKKKPVPWGDDKIQVGDWVQADDGRCVQCLKISEYLPKNHKFFVKWYRFPMCSQKKFQSYEGKKKVRWSEFYTWYTEHNRSRPVIYRKEEERQVNKLSRAAKQYFVKLITDGKMRPADAQKLIFDSKISPVQWGRIEPMLLSTLLRDPIVQEELMEKLTSTPFFQALDSKISDEELVDSLKELLDKSKKGTKEHRDNLLLLMNLKGHSQNRSLLPQVSTKPHELKEGKDYTIENTPPPNKSE